MKSTRKSTSSESQYQRQREELQDNLREMTREAEYSSWNALLTFNAILISVFSAVSIITQANRLPIFALIGCCLLSCVCLIWNFLSRRENVLKQFESSLQPDYNIDIKDLERLNREFKRTQRVFSNIRLREKIAAYILIPEGIIVLWMLMP
jgi:hypothetical protein